MNRNYFKTKSLKYFFLFLIFGLFNSILGLAQDCVFKLQEAEKLYSQGLIEQIPELLNPCINKGLSKEDRLQAYKLIVISYLFDDNQEEAENSMLGFLKLFPEYEVSPTDPVEFVYLFESYSNIPVYSFGISGGLNFSNVFLKEQYGTHNLNQSRNEYNSSGFGYQVGIKINRHIVDKLEFNFELLFKQNKFENLVYIPNLDYIEYNEGSIIETQTRFEMPLSFTYDFEYGKFKPFLRAGFSVGYLSNVNGKIIRKFIDDSQNADVKGPNINLQEHRKQVNYRGIIGGGIKYHIPKGYVMFDIRYNLGLSNQVKPENRIISNSEQIWKYHSIDNNFTLNDVSLSFGYVYLLYKPKRKEQP